MGAKANAEQIAYILASPEPASVVADLLNMADGSVRYIRRQHGYVIQHRGHGKAYKDGKLIDTSNFFMPVPAPRVVKEETKKRDVVNGWLSGRI